MNQLYLYSYDPLRFILSNLLLPHHLRLQPSDARLFSQPNFHSHWDRHCTTTWETTLFCLPLMLPSRPDSFSSWNGDPPRLPSQPGETADLQLPHPAPYPHSVLASFAGPAPPLPGRWIWRISIHRQAPPHRRCVGCARATPPVVGSALPALVAARSSPSATGSGQRVVLRRGQHLRLAPRQLHRQARRYLRRSCAGLRRWSRVLPIPRL
jgi:hypothetical protein